MMRFGAHVILVAVLTLAAARAVLAQGLEPAVDVSASRQVVSPVPAAPGKAPQAAPVPQGEARATPRRAASRAMDRVDLEATQITGNRELPRVLYIVPWRAPRAGDLEGKAVNSLLYELTMPVDRDVFRRENRYFDALAAGEMASLRGVEAPAPRSQTSPAPAPAVDPLRDASQPRSRPEN